ncbi:MAG TPA: hypothetical protein VHZ24_05305 [Pirellulales bacterium]|jgi:Leucine-rich repeat (LRR) protein|nr:hypothetical protein [Pirellulales bacterium]
MASLPHLNRASVLFAALMMCASVGCQRTADTESSLLDQIEAVRGGKSTQIVVESQPTGDADLQRLTGLEKLHALVLDDRSNTITDAGVQALTDLPALVHLRIRGGEIGDAGLATIAQLKSLEIVNLPHTHATDAGLASLGALPNLVQLRLGSPNITDAGVAELKRFLSLRRVHLIDVPLTDAGLGVFHDMPNLESLYLDGTRVSDAAYEALFQARPKLHVHINQQHHDRDPHTHEYPSNAGGS